MASRKEEKEQRRREREAAQQAAVRAERRRRRMRALGGLAALAVAAVVVALAAGRSGSTSAADAFAAKTDGLAQRLADANLTPGSDHFHPTVKLFIGPKPIGVPDDIGGANGAMKSPIHRHAGDQALHAEGVKEGALTLGQFMRVWGVAFSSTQLGPYRTGGGKAVRMWVKEQGAKRFTESRAFGDLQLRDGQQVYLYYGTPQQAPING